MDTVKMKNIPQNTRDNTHRKRLTIQKLKNKKERDGESEIPDGMLAKQTIKTTTIATMHNRREEKNTEITSTIENNLSNLPKQN